MSTKVLSKTVRERLQAGEYETKIPYEFIKTPVNDDMTIRQAREHEAEQKQLRSDHSRRRLNDIARLENEFHADLSAECGLTGHPKEPKVWSLAYEYGHSSGLSEILSYYQDFAELAL